MINEKALKAYLQEQFPGSSGISINKLGSGVQGSGFQVDISTSDGIRSYVIKTLRSDGLGHDYPSDRAGVFLLDLDEYGNLPRHVRALDVLSEMQDGAVRSVGGGKEYYLLMEKVEGRDYFSDLAGLAGKEHLDDCDQQRIRALASYLAQIHAIKKESRTLYLRKVRDTIGHGECLMGVFDAYPEGSLSYEAMAVIEKMCVDWRARLKGKTHRLSQIHGDFHPGNIWFRNLDDFILLDRSRGPWGEPADDITALAINYIFFSVRQHGDVRGACKEALLHFFDSYVSLSADEELTSVVAPFFAFRSAVVANPLFYPDVSPEARRNMLSFAAGVLSVDAFNPEETNLYLSAHGVL